MRDPDRIDPMLEEVHRIWKANPDLRLLQLLLNAIVFFDHQGYFTEDEVLLKRLRQVYGL